VVANKDKPLPTKIIATPLERCTESQAKTLLTRGKSMKLTIPAEETKTIIAAHVEERGFSVSTHTVLADGSHEIEVKFAEPEVNWNTSAQTKTGLVNLGAAAEALGATTEFALGKQP
jgi:hypothetical protein